ncbi:hypothetical protein NEUTE1DRAFT_98934 [Neurospora tetrasperma FGSC 2508]|uniref:Uncharacterized protein n=1 Tax=Neurospora tetrasperma (strain FGSC 2508 / ATCC MYA-4615 / P0657) TaxID=510951 RepID=F8MGZ6_NEUT8|nr:uncharacterized protein NEUTE1DRAFT_98934 [Neurospora tetrasperma FGSC 2508]EGO58715.1 hypothetical protein NEUTE1DRAFT_98934 [Neurospora tetrasperma FGSC 2508]EGZ72804.1 hypothetical protein NEUTE2DRAFT_60944 [Neurospora tetrasperma FGSC 2509]
MSKNHWKKGSGSVSSSRNIDWCLANSRRQEIRILASEKDRSRSEPGTERQPPTPSVCAPVPPSFSRPCRVPGHDGRPLSTETEWSGPSGVRLRTAGGLPVISCYFHPASWRSDATGYYGIPDGPVEWS